MANKKLRVAVIFGGKSPEHEVSVITGMQAIDNLDKEKFDVVPVYVAKDGRWFSGQELLKMKTYRNLTTIPIKATQETITLDTNQKGLQPFVKNTLNPFKKSSHEQPIDVIFAAFHGGLGENGGFSGLFETMDLPYVGPGITGGVLGMDKVVMKQLFLASDIPLTKWLWFYRNDWKESHATKISEIEKQLNYPLFIKPANGGSSIGTTKAHNRKELQNAVEVAAMFDRKIIIEESFENSREINISVMGNAGSELMVSLCEEVFTDNAMLTYEDKYVGEETKTGTQSLGMVSTKRQLPANIPKNIEKKIHDTAKKVFNVLDASGVSRIDFLYREKTSEIVVLEINTIPGSLSFYLWEATGLKFKDMLTKLIDLAFEKYEEGKKNTTTFSSNILENFNPGGSKEREKVRSTQ